MKILNINLLDNHYQLQRGSNIMSNQNLIPYNESQEEIEKYLTEQEIWGRINHAVNKLGFYLVKYKITNREINHKKLTPLTIVLILKNPDPYDKDCEYSVHYLFTYGEDDRSNQTLDQGNYDLNMGEAMKEFNRRVDNELIHVQYDRLKRNN